MSRPRGSLGNNPGRLWALSALLSLLFGCDQLGNPRQLTTGPTAWTTNHHELVTTTHSFRNPRTIKRLVADGLDDLDYSDPSIGPDQTLTFVTVAPRRLRRVRPGPMRLVTRFEIPGQRPIARHWKMPAGSRHWGAAFALPAPPSAAITSVAP